MPEKEQGLMVEQSTDSGRVSAVRLDPIFFTRAAFREIVRFQMFSKDPREIIIITRDRNLYISPDSLRSGRKYYGQERRDFLDGIADEMGRAEKVIVQIPRATEKL